MTKKNFSGNLKHEHMAFQVHDITKIVNNLCSLKDQSAHESRSRPTSSVLHLIF